MVKLTINIAKTMSPNDKETNNVNIKVPDYPSAETAYIGSFYNRSFYKVQKGLPMPSHTLLEGMGFPSR